MHILKLISCHPFPMKGIQTKTVCVMGKHKKRNPHVKLKACCSLLETELVNCQTKGYHVRYDE